MGRKNHRPDLNGLLVIDKPLNTTSAGMCTMVRRRTGGAKVGHAGTLDPLATGVLLICLGRATKLVERLMTGEKGYRATIDLSATSPTDDLEGTPAPVEIGVPPSRRQVEAVLAERFTGRIQQAPPAHSAVHINGKRAYELARAGYEVDVPVKTVEIHAIDILRYDFPTLEIDLRCGRGTYIRSLARDLGPALETGGVLTALRRTLVGPFTLEMARTPDALAEEINAEHLVPLDEVEALIGPALPD